MGEVVAGHRLAHSLGGGVRPDGHDAHALHPAGQHCVFHPGFHQAVAQVHRVLRRPALGIHCAARRFLRQPSGEPCSADHVHGLRSDLIHTAAHYLAYGSRIDARTLDRSRLHLAEQRGGMNGGQAAISLANWGANGVDDDDFSHGPTIEPVPLFQPVETSPRAAHRASTPYSARRSRSNDSH